MELKLPQTKTEALTRKVEKMIANHVEGERHETHMILLMQQTGLVSQYFKTSTTNPRKITVSVPSQLPTTEKK